MIHVIKGLEPGDIVLLTPPLKAAGVDYQAPGKDDAHTPDTGAVTKPKRMKKPKAVE